MRYLSLMVFVSACIARSEAPVLDDLECPVSIAAGATTQVTCTFAYKDDQGDIVDVDMFVGSTMIERSFDHPGSASGTSSVTFPVTCTASGSAEARIELVDAQENESGFQPVSFRCEVPAP